MTNKNNKRTESVLQVRQLEKGIIKLTIMGGNETGEPCKLVDLDIKNSSLFLEEGLKLIHKGERKLIIDMAYVDFVDSEGVWVVFELSQKAKEKKVKIVLVNVTENVKRVFDMTKLSTKVKISGTEIEAINFLTKEL